MVHLLLLSVHSAIIIRFFVLSQFSICLQCTHIHTLDYLRISHSLIIFPSLQNNHGMMNGRIVCGDVIVRISGDQGKKDESLVTHMLYYTCTYMYTLDHRFSLCMCVCVCILVWKDKWR